MLFLYSPPSIATTGLLTSSGSIHRSQDGSAGEARHSSWGSHSSHSSSHSSNTSVSVQDIPDVGSPAATMTRKKKEKEKKKWFCPDYLDSAGFKPDFCRFQADLEDFGSRAVSERVPVVRKTAGNLPQAAGLQPGRSGSSSVASPPPRSRLVYFVVAPAQVRVTSVSSGNDWPERMSGMT